MKLQKENMIINGLWVEGNLSPIELLCIKMAQQQGHVFHLWTYNPNINAPENTIVKDASLIIPKQDVFKKENNDPNFKIGKGSYGAPFSDLFRYKLLHDIGGWWIDMDVILLKPLNIEAEYFFRSHDQLNVIGNVMKAPKNSRLMLETYKETKERCNANTDEWLLPNKILNKHIAQQGLDHFIHKNISNEDIWEKTYKFILKDKRIPSHWSFIHLQNEEWRSRGINKFKINPYSTLGKLLLQHNLDVESKNMSRKIEALLPW